MPTSPAHVPCATGRSADDDAPTVLNVKSVPGVEDATPDLRSASVAVPPAGRTPSHAVMTYSKPVSCVTPRLHVPVTAHGARAGRQYKHLGLDVSHVLPMLLWNRVPGDWQ